MKLFSGLVKREKSYIGMDIGSYAVKTVELSRNKDSYKIKHIGYGTVKKPGSSESLLEAVKESAAKAGIANKEVNIAISGPSVIVRFVELPHMTRDELRNSIPFEAEKYMPFDVSDVVLDHQLLIPHIADNKMLVLLVAAKKDLISERLNLVSEAGLSVGILDVTSFANVNAFLMTPGRNKDETSALIDIGSKATDVNIITEGVLYFTRSIQLGGDELTKALSTSLSLDLESAEVLKLNPGDRKDEVCTQTKGIIQNIIDEIRLSFSYYENQSGKNIDKAYLTGGGTKVLNVCDMLKESLGIEMVRWDPAGFMDAEPSIDSQFFSSIKDQLGVAVGLALR